MELVNHPLVCGPTRRSGLFWFTISPLFTDPGASAQGRSTERTAARYLKQPAIILDRIWALPDKTLHSLGDAENSPVPTAVQA